MGTITAAPSQDTSGKPTVWGSLAVCVLLLSATVRRAGPGSKHQHQGYSGYDCGTEDDYGHLILLFSEYSVEKHNCLLGSYRSIVA